MNTHKLFVTLRNIAVDFAGFVAGGELFSLFSKKENHAWIARWLGLITAQKLNSYLISEEKKPEPKEKECSTYLSYRTDHAERLNQNNLLLPNPSKFSK